jgi:transcriptional antiterminator NusG
MADTQNAQGTQDVQDPQDTQVLTDQVAEEQDQDNLEAPAEQEVVVSNPNHIVISDLSEEDKLKKGAKWYVLHTYAGHENKVAETLQQRIDTMGLEGEIFEFLIPTQEKIRVRRGQRETVKEKIFPGYMLIRMKLTDASWLAVRTTQGVTGFVGIGNKPTPLPKHEVEAIQKFMSQGAPSYKADFTVGEAVKIVDGPFNEFIGAVDAIDPQKGKVTVLVSIFGRETPVELDFLQVSKL